MTLLEYIRPFRPAQQQTKTDSGRRRNAPTDALGEGSRDSGDNACEQSGKRYTFDLSREFVGGGVGVRRGGVSQNRHLRRLRAPRSRTASSLGLWGRTGDPLRGPATAEGFEAVLFLEAAR